MPAMRFARSANRFLLFRYLSAMILNILIRRMMFSMSTLLDEMSLFCFLSSGVSGCFLLLFFGNSELMCCF